MITHGYTPNALLLSTMIPIIMNKHSDVSSIDNYLAIALSNISGKLLDRIILNSHQTLLKTSSLQFSFNEKSSTIMCSALLLEILYFYTNRNSYVYVLCLDASNAFDRLCHVKLLQLLLKRNLCPLVIRFLYKLYTQSKIQVIWNRELSSLFPVKCGVKQRGAASPLVLTYTLMSYMIY